MKKGMIFGIVAAVVVVGGVLAVLLTHKNKDTGMSTMTSNSPSSSSTTTTPQTANAVNIENFAYGPETLTVKKGTTVTWTNKDSAPHTVTVDEGSPPNSGRANAAGPKSDTLNQNDTYTFTFDTAGTYDYHCTFHSNMHGKVVVTE